MFVAKDAAFSGEIFSTKLKRLFCKTHALHKDFSIIFSFTASDSVVL